MSPRKAHRLDPLSSTIAASLAWIRYFAGETRTAPALAEEAVLLHPEARGALAILGLCYERAHRVEDAAHALAQAAARESSSAPIALSWLGHLNAATGDRNGAEAILTRLADIARTQWVAPITEAWVLAGLGRLDDALDCVHRSIDQGDPWLVHMAVDPRLEPVRRHPGFARLQPLVGPWHE